VIERRALPRWWALTLVPSLVVILAIGLVVGGRIPAAPRLELPAWDQLDDHWGTYLSERQWGTPHESVGGNGWGLDYLSAIRRDYRYGEDGIAGLTDREGTFNIAWAVWDREQVRVAERLFGWSNPSGDHGEAIVDRRTFAENTPTSSYARQQLTYPNSSPAFVIDFEEARVDSAGGVLRATARNTSDGSAPLDVVLKGWFHDTALRVELVDGGLLLRGPGSVVAIVGAEPTSRQVSAEKRALDRNLRDGALAGSGPGHIGALAYGLTLDAGGVQAVTLAWAEAPEAAAALSAAREHLRAAGAVLERRQAEADGLFRGEVTQHEAVYRQALMGLLWSQSLYTWDGGGDYAPEWAARIAADDVLMMPDKWEFPWLASWDTGFQAAAASLIDPQLAADQLRFLFSDRWQQPDGHLPCAEWVMADECPPIFAWSAWRVYEAGAGLDFLEEIYPGLQRLYGYWWDELAVDSEGLFTGGFLGMDNLPRGTGTPQADASAWMAFFARHLALIADELDDGSAAAGYRADLERIATAVNQRLWDAETRFYYDIGDTGSFIRTASYSGLVPLIAGIVPEDRLGDVLNAIRDERQFASPHGIRSVSARSVLYQPGYADASSTNSNWRGPIWMPLNYLLVQALAPIDGALADRLRGQLVDLVEADWEATGRFHEYFDADTGEGLGADAQTGWTALVANLVAEGWPAD
jgi:hypothetical protein